MFIERLSRALVVAAVPTWLLLVIVGVSGPAWADPAIRLGARGGVQLGDATDPYFGVDLRVSFLLSPLTINVTFDDVFDKEMSDYQVSVNALYDVTVPLRRVDPYVGIGANVTAFSFKAMPGVVRNGDDNGQRLGMNLVAGACFDLPYVSPFVQVVKQIGAFDPLSFATGLVVALDGDDRWSGCGRRAR